MKKIFSIILAMALCFSLAACGGSAGEDGSAGDGGSAAAKDLVYPAGVVNKPMVVNDVYDYKTVCYTDRSLETMGHIYIYDYIVEPASDGMVDKTVKAMFIFDDGNAWNNGMSFDVLYMDFTKDEYTGGEGNWTVDVDGTEKPIEVLQDEFISGEWTMLSNFVSKYVLTLRMPENYDDVALFFYNTRNKLAVAGEDAPIPDGTPVDKLLDADSQWFILGGKGDDWDTTKTPTYYGTPIEAQVNNIAIRDVLGGDPVFDVPEDVEDGAPPPPPTDTDIPDLEIVSKSRGWLKRDGVSELDIAFEMRDCPEGSWFEVIACVDATGELIDMHQGQAYNPENETCIGVVTFNIDGTQVPADNLNFYINVFDKNDNILDTGSFDLPFDEPYEGEDTPVIPDEDDDTVYEDGDIEDYTYVEIVDWSRDSIKRDGISEIELDFICANTEPDSYAIVKYWIDDPENPVREHKVKNVYYEGSNVYESAINLVVDGTGTKADSVFIEIELYGPDGFNMSVAQLDIPFEE